LIAFLEVRMSLIPIAEQPSGAAIRLLISMVVMVVVMITMVVVEVAVMAEVEVAAMVVEVVTIDGDRILTQVDVRNMYSILSCYPVGRFSVCIVVIRA
jgi:hypothetical protein